MSVSFPIKNKRSPLEPAYYKPLVFGIRLSSVIEVIDVEKRHPTGSFLAFNDISLVPYDRKLIDTSALSTQEVFPFIRLVNRTLN